jgi:hypothetical protein
LPNPLGRPAGTASIACQSRIILAPINFTDGIGAVFLRKAVEYFPNLGAEISEDTKNFLPDRKGVPVHGWSR